MYCLDIQKSYSFGLRFHRFKSGRSERAAIFFVLEPPYISTPRFYLFF